MTVTWPPEFTLAERDRRWSAVRKVMREDDLDVIVGVTNTSMWDQLQASTRYLTCLGESATPISVVFPVEGEVTAVTVGQTRGMLGPQAWVDDLRPSFFAHVDTIINRLRELDANGSRIGVIGLTTGTRFPDGFVPYHGMRRILEAFPKAELVDATAQLDSVRASKSDEELAFLRQAVDIAEGAAAQLVDEVRPGAMQSAVFGRLFAYMAGRGAELPTMVQWASGNPSPGMPVAQAPHRPFVAGEGLRVELESRWAGYAGQITLMGMLRPLTSIERDGFEIQQAALQACYELCRPGHTLRELSEACGAAAAGTDFQSLLLMHGRGLGDDAPLIVPGSKDAGMLDWEIRPNETFVIKPMVRHADGTSVIWGGVVAATPSGALPLGNRKPEIFVNS